MPIGIASICNAAARTLATSQMCNLSPNGPLASAGRQQEIAALAGRQPPGRQRVVFVPQRHSGLALGAGGAKQLQQLGRCVGDGQTGVALKDEHEEPAAAGPALSFFTP